MQCCKKLLERMAPVKEKMDKPTWQQLVAESHKKNVDLCSTYMYVTVFRTCIWYFHVSNR